MRRINSIQVFVFFFSILLVACTPHNEKIADETTSGFPERIVSLAPSLTYSVYLLQSQNKLVGCTDYCILPEGDTNNIQRIASAVDVNIEEVLKLKPDLVITSSLTDPKTIASFRKFGIRVDIYPYAKSYNDICNQFISLGESIGMTELAKQIVQDSKLEIQKLTDSLNTISRVKVFMQIGAKPLFTVIDSSFVCDYIVLAGGINIASGLKSGMYSREQVINQNPDVIIITDMGSIGLEEKKAWEKYHSLSAVYNRQIYIIGSDEVCSPTPASFVTTLKKFVAMIQTNNKSKIDKKNRLTHGKKFFR